MRRKSQVPEPAVTEDSAGLSRVEPKPVEKRDGSQNFLCTMVENKRQNMFASVDNLLSAFCADLCVCTCVCVCVCVCILR